jgi:hypothetical protein
MNSRDLKAALAVADPVDHRTLAEIDFELIEEELFADLAAGSSPLLATTPERIRSPRSRRPLVIAVGAAALAAAFVLVVSLGGGGPEQPAPAYGAELVRFAEASPLLLLEEPGWHVGYANEESSEEGQIEFILGKKLPYEVITETSGRRPPAVRQHRAELNWRGGTLASWVSDRAASADFHTTLPVLGTTAQVFRYEDGHPGDYEFTALWTEAGQVDEFRAPVPDLAAFEAHLGALRQVDSQSWLGALPPSVIKAADHGDAVTEMLRGVTVPAGFSAAQVPDAGLSTDRYQLGAAVTGSVACSWFRQWGEDRAAGNSAGAAEAEAALAGAENWPVMREMETEDAYPQVLNEYAAAMPSGQWYGRPLLGEVESGLGCAADGVPLVGGPATQR